MTARRAPPASRSPPAGMGWWRWDPETGAVWWSPELEQLYGFEPGSFAGDFDAYTEGIHPDDRDHVAAVIDAGGRGTARLHDGAPPDPPRRRGAMDRGPGRADPRRRGDVREWVGIAIDVTARVRARPRAARSRDRVEHRLRRRAHGIVALEHRARAMASGRPSSRQLVGPRAGGVRRHLGVVRRPDRARGPRPAAPRGRGGGRARTGTSPSATGCATPTACCVGSRRGVGGSAGRTGSGSRST